MNKYFGLMQMPIITSRYWNMVHGANPEQIKQDLEGMQVMRVLGNNMAFFLHCKNVALKMGISMPKQEPMVFTNFIR
jgi:multimeric flavodoxin wrbA